MRPSIIKLGIRILVNKDNQNRFDSVISRLEGYIKHGMRDNGINSWQQSRNVQWKKYYQEVMQINVSNLFKQRWLTISTEYLSTTEQLFEFQDCRVEIIDCQLDTADSLKMALTFVTTEMTCLDSVHDYLVLCKGNKIGAIATGVEDSFLYKLHDRVDICYYQAQG